MGWLEKYKLRFLQAQRGISLIETVIALGILGFIGAAFLTGLATTSKNIDLYEQHVTAQCLAQSQLEILKKAPYDNISPFYDTVAAPDYVPSDFIISIDTIDNGSGKQDITVSISRNGHTLIRVTTIKAIW